MSRFSDTTALAAACLLASLVNGAAHAQQVAAVATPVAPLVITATLIPTPIDQVGSSITLITAQQIQDNQWRTLPDALAQTPGLSVVQAGGPGGLTSVFIRGANADQTEVIIDGINVNDPSQGGVYDFGQGLASSLQKIEVLRGPQSSLYGADALGGVINIVTVSGEGPMKLTASLEGGSFDTFNQTAALNGSTGAFHYALGISHFSSGDTPVTPPGLLVPGEAVIGDGFDNLTSTAKLGFDATQTLNFGLVLRYTDATYRSTGENYDVFPSAPDSAQTDQHERQFFSLADAKLNLFQDRFKNVVSVSYANFQTAIQSPDDGYGLPAPVVDNVDRLRLDWLGTIALDARNILVLGVDDNVDRLIDSPVSATEADRGGFAELQTHPIPGLTAAVSGRYDADNRFGDIGTWRLAPAYVIAATGTVLKASVGTGFKAPTLTELFVSYPGYNFYANPDLKPETSIGYDLGFEQPLAGGRVELGATWFHNAITNLIETNAAGDSYANIGRATTYGVESFISWRLSHALSIRADYTWLIARDDITEEELLRRPKNKASLGATWRPGARLTLTSSLLYVGAWVDGNRDFSIPRLMASPYATANVAAAFDLGHGLTLFARVDNLLDRHYQSPVGFDQPGLGAYAGIQATAP